MSKEARVSASKAGLWAGNEKRRAVVGQVIGDDISNGALVRWAGAGD